MLPVITEFSDRSGLIGYLRAGRDASLKRPAKLKPFSKDPSSYDLVVVGTPIWAWTASPPAHTYLKENKGRIRKVAFYCTTSDSGSGKAFDEMAAACGLYPHATLAITERDLASKDLEVKLARFVKDLCI